MIGITLTRGRGTHTTTSYESSETIFYISNEVVYFEVFAVKIMHILLLYVAIYMYELFC